MKSLEEIQIKILDEIKWRFFKPGDMVKCFEHRATTEPTRTTSFSQYRNSDSDNSLMEFQNNP